MFLHQHAKTFRSIADLARAFNLGANGFAAAVEVELDAVGKEIKKTAEKKFGEYQPAVGEYPAWQQLAEVTIEQKAKAGGGEDPLIGYGTREVYPTKLKDSITVQREGFRVRVGTENPLGELHEYGTKKMPPRPFLRPAVYECQEFTRLRMQLAWSNTVKLIASAGI